MRRFFVVCLFGSLLAGFGEGINAQVPAEPKDPVVNLGIQAGLIFPSRFFRVRSNEQVFEDVVYGIQPEIGAQFGALATFRLSSKFQLHGGLTLLVRNYDCSATQNGERLALKLNTTIYELPLQIAYYQRLNDQLLLSFGTGINMQSLPSNLRVRDGRLDVFALKRFFSVPSSLTTAGLEFRKKGSGGFFLGISYCITPFPLYDTVFMATFDGQNKFYSLPHIGDYFCIVGRYYLD